MFANWPSGAQKSIFIARWDTAIPEEPGKKLGQCCVQEWHPVTWGRMGLQGQDVSVGLGSVEHQRLPPAVSRAPGCLGASSVKVKTPQGQLLVMGVTVTSQFIHSFIHFLPLMFLGTCFPWRVESSWP